jgi:putative DNA methylase
MRNTKKLIEVALPLEAINKASAREKSIRHGHPSTLHLWWARRPLAAARAVIFSQMVDDPSEYVDTLRDDPKLKRKAETELKAKRKLWEEAKALHDKAAGTSADIPEPGPAPTLDEVLADQERQRLFRIIEELVKWENTTNETVLQAAGDEIWQSWRRTCAENADHPRAKELFDRKKLPAFHDPFAGGGALPLEAQRLGLESYASDLNPVAVLINKAMIEIPPKFAGKSPVNPEAQHQKAQMDKSWRGAQGLAEDVRYYGKWMRDEAEKRIGYLYPKIEITAAMAKDRPDLKQYVGTKLTVVAWLWVRTVKSPNPAFAQVDVPLASSFLLSLMLGKEAYVEPVISNNGYKFTVKVGGAKDAAAAKGGTKLSRGANFRCLMSGTPIVPQYIKDEGKAGRMGARLMAIVAEGERGRAYLSPSPEMEAVALTAQPTWKPDTPLPADMRSHWTPPYGLTTYGDLFTPRQLVTLTTLSDLVQEARERVNRDALVAGLLDDGKPLRVGGSGATAYGDAVAVYLSFLISKLADKGSTLCTWDAGPASNRTASGRSARVATVRVTFGRQALPMTWDFAEVNFFSESVGSIETVVNTLSAPLEYISPTIQIGFADQADAQLQGLSQGHVVSTDPPYYDNIGYADLSDFFYVWLRRSLKLVFPDLFATLAVPKAEELVATPYRHGSKEKAEAFFLDGMTQAMHRLAELAHPAFPVTIYYAFKQAESDGADGTTNTGWDTFLAAVIEAGFAISGTWPMRTELGNRMIGSGTNALASSIVLVCRKRVAAAPTATRREFVAALKAELPAALAHLQRGNIAPVDLAQAAIGPGMGVYTRYAKVLDAEGRTLKVREALALINQTLDEALAEQEGDFDADSRWALTWFEQSGFDEGVYGVAEQLSKSKNTSVDGMVEAGIVASKGGKVRLLRPDELPNDWDPATDARLTAWEMVHQLIRVLEVGGEGSAAELQKKLGAKAEVARELAYRLYTLCERKRRAAEALAYNGLVQSWPEIARIAREGAQVQTPTERDLFSDGDG